MRWPVSSGLARAEGARDASDDSAAIVGTVLDTGRTWALTEQVCDDLDLYALPGGLTRGVTQGSVLAIVAALARLT